MSSTNPRTCAACGSPLTGTFTYDILGRPSAEWTCPVCAAPTPRPERPRGMTDEEYRDFLGTHLGARDMDDLYGPTPTPAKAPPEWNPCKTCGSLVPALPRIIGPSSQRRECPDPFHAPPEGECRDCEAGHRLVKIVDSGQRIHVLPGGNLIPCATPPEAGSNAAPVLAPKGDAPLPHAHYGVSGDLVFRSPTSLVQSSGIVAPPRVAPVASVEDRTATALDKCARVAGYERAWVAPSGEPNIILERKHPTDPAMIQMSRLDLLIAPSAAGREGTVEKARRAFYEAAREFFDYAAKSGCCANDIRRHQIAATAYDALLAAAAAGGER